MNALQIIGLLLIIISAAAVISYLLQAGKHSEDQPTTETFTEYTKQELDNIKLAEELYNKKLRPIAAKQGEQLEVVEPEFVAKVVETSKVLPPEATINAQAITQSKDSKPEFPIDKPKKRRKSNNKNKK